MLSSSAFALAVARVQQDQEIADFLRDLVGDDGDRGDDAQLVIGEERGGDQDAVDEIVEGVADDDHHAAAAVIVLRHGGRVVRLALLDVAVAPQHQLFQHEERQDAGEYGARDLLDAVGHAEGVGQDFEEHGAEQRAHRVADEDRHPGYARVERERRGDGYRQHAAGKRCRQYPGQRGHFWNPSSKARDYT